MIVFDIETGPLSEEEVLAMAKPFEEPRHPGEFDPGSVKLGVMKDPVKIEAKIAESRAKHEAAVAEYESNKANALAGWKEENMRSAALSAMTGKVLAIGFKGDAEKAYIETEEKMLITFWKVYNHCYSRRESLVGHCIFQFDLPFLIRRSWLLDIEVPSSVFDGRYFNRIFVDTAKHWLLGQYSGERYSLDLIARFLGCGAKNGDGGEFARLLAEDREAAIAYLLNDLRMSYGVALRMGVK